MCSGMSIWQALARCETYMQACGKDPECSYYTLVPAKDDKKFKCELFRECNILQKGRSFLLTVSLPFSLELTALVVSYFFPTCNLEFTHQLCANNGMLGTCKSSMPASKPCNTLFTSKAIHKNFDLICWTTGNSTTPTKLSGSGGGQLTEPLITKRATDKETCHRN